MKKKIIIVISAVVVILLIAFLIRENIMLKGQIDENVESSIPKKNQDMLSMMLETEAGSGNYEMTTRESWPTEGYKFNSELSKCEHGSELSWDDVNKSVLMSGNVSDKCYIYFDLYNPTLAEYVVSQYNGVQGNNNIYYHDSSLANGAGDNSYRYAGSSETTNNFVCFGTNENPCPTDNLYRIIGIFGENVKLIKYDYATNEMLGTDGLYSKEVSSTDYSNYKGSLNDIAMYEMMIDESLAYNESLIIKLSSCKDSLAVGDPCDDNVISQINYTPLGKINLNTNFINFLPENFKQKIKNSNWIINYFDNSAQFSTAQNIFLVESASGGITYEGKIGLMYVSDYGFAANPSAWKKTLDTYNDTIMTTNNWMYMGVNENVITDFKSSCNRIIIGSAGDLYFASTYADIAAIRPTFYLNSDVTYKSGTGTKTDPIILGD